VGERGLQQRPVRDALDAEASELGQIVPDRVRRAVDRHRHRGYDRGNQLVIVLDAHGSDAVRPRLDQRLWAPGAGAAGLAALLR